MDNYTLDDAGCYVDSARGQYTIDAIVEIGIEHGMPEPEPCDACDACRAVKGDDWRPSMCEWAGEIEDRVDAFMNEHFGVDGAYWGRNDNGDWGLWTIGEDD